MEKKHIHKSYDINVGVTNFIYDGKIVFELPDDELGLYVDTTNPDYSYTDATRRVEAAVKQMLELDGYAVA